MTTSQIPLPQPIGQLNRPLAIVGMSCRLPGADGVDEFWQMLQSGASAIQRMPDSKLNRELYFDPVKGRRGKTYSDIGGCISQRELDWSILPIERSEAGHWDPCHLILCEAAAAACCDAGWDPRNLPLRKGAVFVGHSGGSTLGGEIAYRSLLNEQVDLISSIPGFLTSVEDLEGLKSALLDRLQAGRPQRDATGQPMLDAGFASALISRALGLTGTHMSIDAACASSLVALALGAASLQTGQSDFAIVGGASFNKSDSMILFSQAQSCSASGSRPFDDAADGLISSEGYVAIVLKTLERALADGDRVHAVVRGIGISSDGRGKSLWAPRKEGQYTAIRRAYSGDVTPASISMIEAHATSTQVGDATEMEALSQFFGEHCRPGQRIPVGSVKSNIGHTLETAGLAGVVKSVLAIQHATIPPSVNVKNLNRSIKWDEIPLYVATQCSPWPTLAANVPRRAAINAFGIGGLNVHVIVEQFLKSESHLNPSNPQSSGRSAFANVHPSPGHPSPVQNVPIAVIGRGLVIPGASSVDQLRSLLSLRANQVVMPSTERFGCNANRSNAVPCGFVRGFEYDWRKHKVPPKQIAQANPLQFMLLEAAEQALRESRCLEREFDRQNTAVVVGSIFGGDFGNALFSGLRLPEFKHHLKQLLIERGATMVEANSLTEAYEATFLKVCPALLDETGSFTSSTLASRLSKTFDLMGGAMAIDSGDVSSFAALQAASQLLVTRTVNQVLCAAAHRALDVAAMEALSRLGRLRDAHQHASQAEGYFVGEGVAVVMLKRLSDAQRDGDKVLAVIEGIAQGFDAKSLRRSVSLASDRLADYCTPVKQLIGGIGISAVDSQVELALASSALQVDQPAGRPQQVLARSLTLPLTGHLQAAQGLTDLIAVTLDESSQTDGTTVVLASHTFSGQSYTVAVRSDVKPTKVPRIVNSVASAVASPNQASLIDGRIWRFGAASLGGLEKQLRHYSDYTVSQIQNEVPAKYSEEHAWRAAVVCDERSILGKLKLLSAQLGNTSSRVPLSEQGVFWCKPEERSERVAWLFPGQGSQYHGMFDSFVATEPAAARALGVANSLLSRHGHPTFDQLAWCPTESLGENVWHTQAAMLVADWVMLECLRERGYQPTLVSGHSYGEFAAMLAAGCWDFENALLATWHRCQSIVKNVPPGCSMLSIHACREKVEQLIQDESLPLFVSHINAPEQIVVGGKQAAIAHLSELLDDEGIGTRILAVPTAFHTPALLPAQPAFRSGLAKIDIQPPRIPLLSSVTVRYEADPLQIADNLVDQLTHPVDFVALCQRLKHDKVGLILEVGPQQVLSRLVRQNLSDSVQVIATDHSKRGAKYQLLCAEASIELFGAGARESRPSLTSSSGPLAAPSHIALAPIHFDATQTRRDRMRNLGRWQAKQSSPYPSASAGYDAGMDVPTAFLDAQPPVSDLRTVKNRTAEVPEQPSVPPQVETTKNATDRIAAFLIDFVVEQTGYPAEIIELDWDIEADLGIDSIKKAQLFGELREFFDLESLKNFSLDHYKTLRDIAKLLEQTPGKGQWLQANVTSSVVEAQPSVSRSGLEAFVTSSYGETPIAPSTNHSGPTAKIIQNSLTDERLVLTPQQLQQFLIDFVVEQTGYPAEIVELDADLEADLGIDSIKKAQLFGELREMFSFNGRNSHSQNAAHSADGRQSLADYRTLRDVMDALLQSQPTATTATEPPAKHLPAPAARSVDPSDTHFVDCHGAQTDDGNVGSRKRAATLHDTVATPSDWPLAVISIPVGTALSTDFKLGTNANYREALASNLRAMVGRKDAPQSQAKKNGNGASLANPTQSAAALGFAEKIAETSATLQQSILALDKALLTTCIWRQGAGESLASLDLPAWLHDGGGEIVGLVVKRSGTHSTIQIMPAGCLRAGAAIHDLNLLAVGGVFDSAQPNAAAGQAVLSRWISEDLGSSFDEALKSARNIRVASDWWVKLLDANSGQQALIESREGVLVIERSSALSKMPSHDLRHQGLTVQFDEAHRCFQLSLANSSFQLTNTVLRLDHDWLNHRASVAQPTALSGPDAQPSQQGDVASATVASRYVLRMAPASQRNATNRQPTWGGATLIIGDNPIARQLEARIRTAGLTVVRLAAHEDPTWLAGELEELWKTQAIAHLFLTTPCDSDAAITLDETRWRSRRNKGIMGNYWLCQRWLNRIVEAKMADDASIVAITSQGGDFGISGQMHSAEGGALAGLLKSILVESWMQGIRTLPIKIMDTHSEQSPAEVVENLWRELSIPSYDTEVSYQRGIRHVMRAVRKPVQRLVKPIPQGGTWVCTGGARGITAYVAEQLASRYDLKLHLLGKTEQQEIDPSWLELDDDGLRRLRSEVMTAARSAGKNPVHSWQDTEKLLEIAATLSRLKSLGIDAYYHACDVANRASVRRVLERVRSISGPIQGVLHGAGVGKDARFDRKQPEKVDQCIAAKVDGALALMDATQLDPLEYFVGFGSISGRFGANGHTDYSLANEMLIKQIDWFKQRRPQVKAVGFYWHAWGDVGMATKPETRLALEMIDMHFMPAAEGLQHLLAELEGDSAESEVLITDDRYYRMYYPGDSLDAVADRSGKTSIKTPLLDPASAEGDSSVRVFSADVDPGKDPFLTEHTLDRSPLMPFVIAAEMLIEAAAAHLSTNDSILLHELEAVRALRFFCPTPRRLRIESSLTADGSASCKLQSDFFSRDGRLIEANRTNFKVRAAVGCDQKLEVVMVQLPSSVTWLPVAYPATDAQFHVGWPLQRLRKVALFENGLVGKISAPALIELAGTKRNLRGWRIPSAAMDACLFATGILAWQRVAAGTALPVRISRLEIGRLPSPGEACQVHIQLLSHSHERARFDFTLYGVDGEMILNAKEYEVVWLSREVDEKSGVTTSSVPK